MSFSQIQGNAQVVKALTGMVDSGRIPHAIMLCEDNGGGAISIAQAFLEYLFCKNRVSSDSCGECPSCNKISKLIHPDVHYVFPVSPGSSMDYIDKWRALVLDNPFFTEDQYTDALGLEGKSALIAVGESKQILETLSLSALERGYRAFVVFLPEKMNRDAANRLLKAIEEPDPMTQFVFITHAPENVLPTISSRCQRIRVMPVYGQGTSSSTFEEDTELFNAVLKAITSKDLVEALNQADAIAALQGRDRQKRFCRFFADQLRAIFLDQQGIDLPHEPSIWANSVKRNFARQALLAVSRANSLIERNVNGKIVFTDLINRLYQIVL